MRNFDDCCLNCVYRRPALDDNGAVDFSRPGQCKFDPPAIQMVPAAPPQGFAFAAIRPSVADKDWCGKHERVPS